MENKEEPFFPNFDPTKDLSHNDEERRMKRGLGAETTFRIRNKRCTKELRNALLISYNTYKKYARKYSIFEDLKNLMVLVSEKDTISKEKVFFG